jgi:hypothetical protein
MATDADLVVVERAHAHAWRRWASRKFCIWIFGGFVHGIRKSVQERLERDILPVEEIAVEATPAAVIQREKFFATKSQLQMFQNALR